MSPRYEHHDTEPCGRERSPRTVRRPICRSHDLTRPATRLPPIERRRIPAYTQVSERRTRPNDIRQHPAAGIGQRPRNKRTTPSSRTPVEACREFSELSAYLDSARERRERLYLYLQGAYFLGFFYRRCPEEYRRFSDLDVWRGVPQKPKRHNVMRMVLAFTMGVIGPGLRKNRIYKYAPVLEYFFRKEVLSDDVPRLLKEGGGVDAIYASITAETPGRPRDEASSVSKKPSPSCRWRGRRMGRSTPDTSLTPPAPLNAGYMQTVNSMALSLSPTTMAGNWPSKAGADQFQADRSSRATRLDTLSERCPTGGPVETRPAGSHRPQDHPQAR